MRFASGEFTTRKFRDGITFMISTVHPSTEEVLVTICISVYIGASRLIGVHTLRRLRVGLSGIISGIRSVLFHEFEPVEI